MLGNSRLAGVAQLFEICSRPLALPIAHHQQVCIDEGNVHSMLQCGNKVGLCNNVISVNYSTPLQLDITSIVISMQGCASIIDDCPTVQTWAN